VGGVNAHEVAEINEARRRLPPRPLRGDHDAPYAPSAPAPERFRLEGVDASVDRALIVLGPPMRCLMPADANPFPMFRPFRWLAVEKWVRR
jgi:hypothetical protein